MYICFDLFRFVFLSSLISSISSLIPTLLFFPLCLLPSFPHVRSFDLSSLFFSTSSPGCHSEVCCRHLPAYPRSFHTNSLKLHQMWTLAAPGRLIDFRPRRNPAAVFVSRWANEPPVLTASCMRTHLICLRRFKRILPTTAATPKEKTFLTDSSISLFFYFFPWSC